jgi:hypothetical protein
MAIARLEMIASVIGTNTAASATSSGIADTSVAH